MGQTAGTLALSIGGRIIGGLVGGPIGGAIGGLAGGIIGSLIFNRSTKPLVQDYRLANSSYGRPIPLIYGQWRSAGTVIWETDITTQSSSGLGKGFGGGQSQYKYFQSAAFAFCQGPARLLKVWLDGKLFYDATNTNPTEIVSDPKAQFLFRIYQGDETQLPDPIMVDWDNVNVAPKGACPAYRGLAYFVCQNIPLNYFGNRMPNFSAAWATDVTDNVGYTKLSPLAADATFQAQTGGNIVQAVASVDWQDGTIYVLNGYSGQVSMFSTQSGQELLYKSWSQIFVGSPPYTGIFPAETIVKIPGGGLYLGFGSGAADRDIFTLNPNTLEETNTVTVSANPGDAGVAPGQLLGFQLVSAAAGAVDMLCRVDAPFQSAQIINPFSGNVSGWLEFQYSLSATGSTAAVVGKQDTVAGTVELWFASGSFFGPGLYIYKVTVNGTDPSGITMTSPWFEQVAILTPADFGSGYGGGFDLPSMIYSPGDDTLIITETTGFAASIKWSPSTGVVWVGAPVQGDFTNGALYDISSGPVGTGSIGTFSVTDSATGQVIWTATGQPGNQTPGDIYSYSSQINALFYLTSANPGSTYTAFIAYLQRVTVNQVSVGAILTDLCIRAGVPADAIDVSQITAQTLGYGVEESEKAYGAAIADLCQTYNIDMVESDYTLKFVPRGQPAVATIPQGSLVSIDREASHFWEAKRAIEQEMPLQINVRYYDPDLDYQTGSSYAKRIALPVPTVFAKRVKTVDLPIVAFNGQAHQIAESWLYTMWAERETYKTKLGQQYLWLDPTDNITVTLTEETVTVRIEQSETGDDYSIAIEAASEDLDTYWPSQAPPASIFQTPQVLTQSPAMNLIQLNIPLLQDADDLGGAQERGYFMAAPQAGTTTTDAAALYESTDGGTTYPLVASIATFANWGYGQSGSVLGDTVSKFATDYVNVVKITLAPGSTLPANVSYTDLMNGANVAIIGSEIIQFMTSTLNSDGSYTLSTLLRGRRGTEWATGTHIAGEQIVFVENSDVLSLALPLAQIGVPELWKLVANGRVLGSTPASVFTYLGYDLKPYAPVNFNWSASGSDLVLTWERRSRLGGGDGLIIDGVDTVPLGEASELYNIYFIADASHLATFSPTDPTTYVRTYSPTSATLTYTAAQMSTDGFTRGVSTLYVVGYQVSAVVGRGFQGYQAVPGF